MKPTPTLTEALELCQKALSMMINPAQIDQTSTLQAFAIATEAEAKARAALSVPKIKNDPENYLTVGKVQSKIAEERKTALSVQPAAAVVGEPEGWKLVPIEPTQEMIDAGRLARMNIAGGYDGPSSWEAMLAAAPSAPDGWQKAIDKVLAAEADFRSNMPDDWQGDPLSDAIAELRAALGGASHE